MMITKYCKNGCLKKEINKNKWDYCPKCGGEIILKEYDVNNIELKCDVCLKTKEVRKFHIHNKKQLIDKTCITCRNRYRLLEDQIKYISFKEAEA